ncbi:hypothetical protein OK015_26745 [Mycobacterium sp. Aquia_216]|uniref:hypothetical protein n=1 Tax=Mycobacterium sp. Aquia_216 TaxID=2991729 RepID=UPI00227D43BF|nr:hypothetical protein [Mycobacterium sp. Aquia_216]WAJ44660.1 hypothetical protein OK015_26745 [Mycobacterium sp. Aquia_216]
MTEVVLVAGGFGLVGSPIGRHLLKRRGGYRDSPGGYADAWRAIHAEFGEPGSDTIDRSAGVPQ